jgi:hypothetical protein
VTGRFGLRASPGGFATPAFGPGPEVLRVTGTLLVRETARISAYLPMAGATLRDLAGFASADLAAAFSAGADAPDPGDADEPLLLDAGAAAAVADWFAFGWEALDRVLSGLPNAAEPEVLQLWPEHFDAGTSVGLSSGGRVNLGASPGDAFCAEPYLYVSPRTAARPVDPAFWNAPFGAILPSSALGVTDPVGSGVAFLLTGLRYMERSGSAPVGTA